MKKTLIIAAMLCLASVAASAQGALLKKLGDKAAGAVEKKVGQKVEQTVSNKLGQILGVEDTPTATTNTGKGSETVFGYAESLLDSDSGSGIYASAPEKSSFSFGSYAQALKARPDWPSTADMASVEALEKYYARLKDYELGVQTWCDAMMQKNSGIYDRALNGTATDQPRCNEIYEELNGIYIQQVEGLYNHAASSISSMQSVLLGGRAAVNENTLSGALYKQKKQITEAWPRSQECHQVNVLENKGASKQVRSEQNAIIDRWNAKQLEQWVAVLKRFDGQSAAAAKRIAELDAELDSMSEPVKQSSAWAAAKNQAITLNGVILTSATMPLQVFDCPLVRRVWED